MISLDEKINELEGISTLFQMKLKELKKLARAARENTEGGGSPSPQKGLSDQEAARVLRVRKRAFK